MPVRPATYGAPAITLHWLVAGLIFLAFPLGVYMHELPISPWRLRLYSLHKSIGMTALLIAGLRVIWRFGHATPPPPLGTSAWAAFLARGTHGALYLLMFAVPLSGWLMSSAFGFQVVWFGVVPLPDLIGKDKPLGEILKTAHLAINLALAALVMAHVAAAVKHRFVDQDEVWTRMRPW